MPTVWFSCIQYVLNRKFDKYGRVKLTRLWHIGNGYRIHPRPKFWFTSIFNHAFVYNLWLRIFLINGKRLTLSQKCWKAYFYDFSCWAKLFVIWPMNQRDPIYLREVADMKPSNLNFEMTIVIRSGSTNFRQSAILVLMKDVDEKCMLVKQLLDLFTKVLPHYMI